MLNFHSVGVMPFCPNCGREVPREVIYCPYCGSQVRRDRDQDWKAGTGLDLLMADSRVQQNWVSRLVAYTLDSILIGVFVLIIGGLLSIPFIIGSLMGGGWRTWESFFGIPFSMGVVQVIYFTLMEGVYGASFGKQVMGLRVVDAVGRPLQFTTTLLRNLSKVYWALLMLDLLIGLLSRADPRQKFTDQIAGTKVLGPEDRFRQRISRPTALEMRSYPTNRREGGDPLGTVSFGVVIIIVAAVLLLYPNVFSQVIVWFEGWGRAGPTMLSNDLIQPLTWFLSVVGVWGLALAALRIVSKVNRRGSISDAFGGCFFLAAAYLLRLYASGVVRLSILLPAFVIAFGSLILLGSLVTYFIYGRVLPKG